MPQMSRFALGFTDLGLKRGGNKSVTGITVGEKHDWACIIETGIVCCCAAVRVVVQVNTPLTALFLDG